MSEHYRLVYMLAVKLDGGAFKPLTEHGEFQNRAAAKKYCKDRHFEEGDIYLVRKEVSIFYDRKLVDKEDS